MCALLVGLPDVTVLGVEETVEHLRVHVEVPVAVMGCRECGTRARVKERPVVELVDLPCFGRPTRLVWRKHRWSCPDPDCETRSWTGECRAVAPPRAAMTDRAGRWATVQVGRNGRSVAEVARELGCDWHTINDAVIAYGTPLVEDADRIGPVSALGLDETLFCRRGRWRRQEWCTSIVDVTRPSQLLDVVEDRSAAGPSTWIDAQPESWRAGIRWGVLDLSGPYRKTFTDTLPDVGQVADPFHLVRLANQRLDECRRRVQNETLGHRGRKPDPLYRSRRLLTKGHERLDEHGEAKLESLLTAGDPHGEVRMAWHAKEVIRSIYDITQPADADEFVARLADDLQDESCPPEMRQLGRTIGRWCTQITNWHRARVSNGPTEAANNLVKRIKRVGFGFRRFTHYRIRVLLYAESPTGTYSPPSTPLKSDEPGKPNWDLLATVDSAEIR